jgi:hypothetical protein
MTAFFVLLLREKNSISEELPALLDTSDIVEKEAYASIHDHPGDLLYLFCWVDIPTLVDRLSMFSCAQNRQDIRYNTPYRRIIGYKPLHWACVYLMPIFSLAAYFPHVDKLLSNPGKSDF